MLVETEVTVWHGSCWDLRVAINSRLEYSNLAWASVPEKNYIMHALFHFMSHFVTISLIFIYEKSESFSFLLLFRPIGVYSVYVYQNSIIKS